MNASTAKAAAHIDEFVVRRDADLLEAAADSLQAVAVSDEPDPERRRALRAETLEQWLRLFAAIDAARDPKFDPGDLPSVRVSPPPVGDMTYPPGVDPSMIKDPAARSEYERSITENRRKTESYNLQTKLRRLDDRLQPRLEAFVHAVFASSKADRQEIEAAIQAFVPARQRAEQLRRRLVPPTTP